MGRRGIVGVRGARVGHDAVTAASGRAARYPIRAVSKLTGIAIDTLRAWERRYAAVTPVRDDRGRLYTDADVARLRLIHQAVSAGHAVGRVASLGDAELRRLVTAHAAAESAPASPGAQDGVVNAAHGAAPASPSDGAPGGTVSRAGRPASPGGLDLVLLADALRRFDSVAVDHEFSRLATLLPPMALVRDILLPAVRDAGNACHRRDAGIAHEHLISAAMRHLLGSFLRMYARRAAPIRLLFATLPGDRHEIGILGAAMLAAAGGFAVSYIGPDLPVADIVDAVKASRADVLVLGVTLAPRGDRHAAEMRALTRTLPPSVELWTGGPAAARSTHHFGARALPLPDFDVYARQLARLAGHATNPLTA